MTRHRLTQATDDRDELRYARMLCGPAERVTMLHCVGGMLAQDPGASELAQWIGRELLCLAELLERDGRAAA